MVGDSARDDIVAGNRAGCSTVLFDSYVKHLDPSDLEGERRPAFIAWNMEQVLEVFRQELELPPQRDML